MHLRMALTAALFATALAHAGCNDDPEAGGGMPEKEAQLAQVAAERAGWLDIRPSGYAFDYQETGFLPLRGFGASPWRATP